MSAKKLLKIVNTFLRCPTKILRLLHEITHFFSQQKVVTLARYLLIGSDNFVTYLEFLEFSACLSYRLKRCWLHVPRQKIPAKNFYFQTQMKAGNNFPNLNILLIFWQLFLNLQILPCKKIDWIWKNHNLSCLILKWRKMRRIARKRCQNSSQRSTNAVGMRQKQKAFPPI